MRTSRRARPVKTAVRDTFVGLRRLPNSRVATSTYAVLATSANSRHVIPQRINTCTSGLSHWRVAAKTWLVDADAICETNYLTAGAATQGLSLHFLTSVCQVRQVL